jgi:TRAP-type C4-dicarboxylate transport system permease small subunit
MAIERDDPGDNWSGPAAARPIFCLVDRVSWLGSAALILLASIVIIDVVGRAFSAPLSSGSDIGAMLMVALIFFAIGGTQVDKDHVSMDALVTLFPERMRRLTDKINLVVCLLLGLFLTYGAVKAGMKSFTSGEMALGALALPLWPAKFVVAFGFLLYSLVVLAQLFGANPSGKTQDSMPPAGTE